jgi:hypothetical protein
MLYRTFRLEEAALLLVRPLGGSNATTMPQHRYVHYSLDFWSYRFLRRSGNSMLQLRNLEEAP